MKRQVHTSPTKQRSGLGIQNKCTHKPCDTESELRGLRESTQVTAMQKDPHKHLPSKFGPAAQGRTGNRSSNDPRDK